MPNNPQNGGDFLPLVWDGAIPDGTASWTTDYNFAKSIFREDQDRVGEMAALTNPLIFYYDITVTGQV